MSALIELRSTSGRTTFRTGFGASGVVRPRAILVCLGLGVATFLLFCLGMTLGDYPVGVGDVLLALFGKGEYATQLVVYDWRMPRTLVGLLVGMALGLAGALLQSVTRNPLASPDVLGVTAGASTAVVAGVVLGLGAPLGSQALGLVGAFGTATLIYLLAWKRGTTSYRIVLVGVGVSWVCVSATQYLLARANIQQAQQVVGWMVGNLNSVTWTDVGPLAVSMLLLMPLALFASGWLRSMQLGDDVAVGLGTPVQGARLTVLVTSVGLVSFAVAAAGPVAFVALSAPQIAKRLTGATLPPALAGALAGAVIVLGSDLIAQRIVPDSLLPVGVVTGVLGAPFLLWLLVRANRVGSGG